jgi:hypothetical protein
LVYNRTLHKETNIMNINYSETIFLAMAPALFLHIYAHQLCSISIFLHIYMHTKRPRTNRGKNTTVGVKLAGDADGVREHRRTQMLCSVPEALSKA